MHSEQVKNMKDEGKALSVALQAQTLGTPTQEVERARDYLDRVGALLSVAAQEERQRAVVLPGSPEEAKHLAGLDSGYAQANPHVAGQFDLTDPMAARDAFVKTIEAAGKRVDSAKARVEQFGLEVAEEVARKANVQAAQGDPREDLKQVLHGRGRLDRVMHAQVNEDKLDRLLNEQKDTVVQGLVFLHAQAQKRKPPEEYTPLDAQYVKHWLNETKTWEPERRNNVAATLEASAQDQARTERNAVKVFGRGVGISEAIAGSGYKAGESESGIRKAHVVSDLEAIATHLSHLEHRAHVHDDFERARQQNARQTQAPVFQRARPNAERILTYAIADIREDGTARATAEAQVRGGAKEITVDAAQRQVHDLRQGDKAEIKVNATTGQVQVMKNLTRNQTPEHAAVHAKGLGH